MYRTRVGASARGKVQYADGDEPIRHARGVAVHRKLSWVHGWLTVAMAKGCSRGRSTIVVLYLVLLGQPL